MNDETHSLSFPSWDAFTEHCTERDNSAIGHSRRLAKDAYDGPRWYAGAEWEDAVRMAREGWPEGADQINRFVSAFADKLSSMVAIERWLPSDPPGDFIDPVAYTLREPLCAYASTQEVAEAPSRSTHEIILDASVSGGISGDVIIRRGAAALALAALLETRQIPTRIFLRIDGVQGSRHRIAEIVLKDYGMPLHLGIAAFALAHPCTLRRFFFAFVELGPNPAQWIPGYGSPAGTKASDYPGATVINSATWGASQWDSDESALAFVRARLEAAGVTLVDGGVA